MHRGRGKRPQKQERPALCPLPRVPRRAAWEPAGVSCPSTGPGRVALGLAQSDRVDAPQGGVARPRRPAPCGRRGGPSSGGRDTCTWTGAASTEPRESRWLGGRRATQASARAQGSRWAAGGLQEPGLAGRPPFPRRAAIWCRRSHPPPLRSYCVVFLSWLFLYLISKCRVLFSSGGCVARFLYLPRHHGQVTWGPLGFPASWARGPPFGPSSLAGTCDREATVPSPCSAQGRGFAPFHLMPLWAIAAKVQRAALRPTNPARRHVLPALSVPRP